MKPARLKRLEARLTRDWEKLAADKRKAAPEPVRDYFLSGPKGPVKLSSLFGGKKDLIVIHNMGRSCPYCTLWADGFNGLLPHLQDRAAFAVVSPDPVPAQRKFAAGRGWKFPMYSGHGSTFIKDMGFMPRPGEPWPGVSTFRRRGSKLYRVASAPFGPFDPFCSLWHLFALLDGGARRWAPKYKY
jgi:predicted dithiol-disulfide oxidoreductase (DUF899 family)